MTEYTVNSANKTIIMIVSQNNTNNWQNLKNHKKILQKFQHPKPDN